MLATENFDIVPSTSKPSDNQLLNTQNSTNQPLATQLVESFQQLPKKTNCIYSTHSNVALLEKEKELLENENKILKSKNKRLKTTFVAISEELEAYKSPGTCSLRTALKYSVPRTSQSEVPNVSSDQQKSESPPPKKHKTLPFARLLTCEESWEQLRTAREEENKKIAETKQRKEIAAKKKEERELKKEETARKKKEKARQKEEMV